MLEKLLWIEILLTIIFIVFEYGIKSTLKKKAKIFYFEKIHIDNLLFDSCFKNRKLIDNRQYFFDNAGIFIGAHHPGLFMFSSIDSIFIFLALIFTILSFIFTTYIQSICFAGIFLFMMFISPMPSCYPCYGNKEINFKRTLYNHCHKNFTSLDDLDILYYETLFNKYNRIIEEYIMENKEND